VANWGFGSHARLSSAGWVVRTEDKNFKGSPRRVVGLNRTSSYIFWDKVIPEITPSSP
jgi:hypothetical protein